VSIGSSLIIRGVWVLQYRINSGKAGDRHCQK